MVCPIETGKMTALARLLGVGTVSQTLTGGGHQKLAVQYLRRELQDADEANLLDEEDMHIFGLRPMTDPLDLVCCNACKKPIKASHYAAHAELCKYLSLQVDVSLELDGNTVNRKPRKERKKLQTTQTTKASSVQEPKNFKAVDSEDIAASDAHVDARIPGNPAPQTKTRNMGVTSRPKPNGLRVSPCDVDCSGDVTRRSSKPLKRAATESPSDSGNKDMCKTLVEIPPYAPAPLATKIYYSQRNHRLRKAIRQMFFVESFKDPSQFCQEQVVNQQSDCHFLHRIQTQDQMLGASSEVYMSRHGRIAPSMNVASQLPRNNTIESHCPSKSYSFASEPGNCIGTVQQGCGSVPVV